MTLTLNQFLKKRKAKKDIKNLIEYGAEITNIQTPDKKSVIINFKRDGKSDSIII